MNPDTCHTIRPGSKQFLSEAMPLVILGFIGMAAYPFLNRIPYATHAYTVLYGMLIIMLSVQYTILRAYSWTITNEKICRRHGVLSRQTDYIERMVGEGRRALKMFICGNLRIALVSDNIPVSQIPTHITRENIAERLVILHNTLKRDFFIDNPRIAVLSLNPHADGKEENEIIVPVIDELFKRGVRCVGPYAAEAFFGANSHTHFDAVLAMYYDQGVSAFKALALNEGVNYTAGLPILRTAPAVGVNYEQAGKDMTDEQAFRQAIYTAIDAVRNRTRFDRERTNPLQKQYVAKRDDSDKLKLDQVTEEE